MWQALLCALLLLSPIPTTTLNAQPGVRPAYAQRRSALQQQATTALAEEDSAARADVCSVPANTADTSRCVRQTSAGTNSHYEIYAAAIAGLLRLQPPDATAPEVDDARANVQKFRKAESLWLRYRDAQCDAVETMSCTQELTRHHLQELAGLYARLF